MVRCVGSLSAVNVDLQVPTRTRRGWRRRSRVMEDLALRVAPPLESRPVLDSEPHIKQFLGQPAQHNHIVQFYEREDFLYDNVAHFVAAGLTSGEPVIVIATQAHRTAFVARLKLNAIDVAAATSTGQLTLLDAEE